jgi:hypothetical protein
MSLVKHDVPVSSKRLWAGRIVSALPALLLLFSGTMKLFKVPAVIEGMAHYGYPEHRIVLIGMLEVGCTIVYLVPRTAVLGAILMTAYLGGATATNVRVGDSSFIGPILAGVFVWAGLYLRDRRLSEAPILAKLNHAGRSKRLRMRLASYKSTDGMHDAIKFLSLTQPPMSGTFKFRDRGSIPSQIFAAAKCPL